MVATKASLAFYNVEDIRSHVWTDDDEWKVRNPALLTLI